MSKILLEIKNLHAGVEGKEILKGIDLTIREGEVHAVMGPNGAGKSTLGGVLTGRPGYEVTEGSIVFDGKDLLAMSPEERSWAGIFLSFQYPVEIPGVSITNFMKAAINAKRKAMGQPEIKPGEFLKLLKEKMALVGMKGEFARRDVNVGFSGGEKKRNEIFQMAMLEPRFSRRRRQGPAHARDLGHSHHPLPQIAGLHRPGRGARAQGRPHCRDCGQGARGQDRERRIRESEWIRFT